MKNKFEMKMKVKNLILSTLFLVPAYVSRAQLVVDNTTQTPEQLVQNVLAGTGVTVTNVTFNGSVPMAKAAQVQVGYFDATAITFPIAEGIILATGNAQFAIGPNNTTAGFDNVGVAPDPNDTDINAILAPSPANNEAILEFDFIPTGDSISFSYIFASEEYHEYSTSTFNDGFGFIISGPGFAGPFFNGGENIAIIPGTTLPVTMNNLNNGSANIGPCVNCGYLVDNTNGLDLQHDAHTVTLTATAAVQCGKTYHIKLAIADAVDVAYDSAVFLEANSFSSNSPDISINLVDVNGDPLPGDELIEGCSSAAINFVKPDGETNSTFVVNVTSSGTATNGTDYTQLNPSYTIPPGKDSITVMIAALADALTEGTETLIIEGFFISPCGDTIEVSDTINIIDSPPVFNVFANDTIIDCPQTSIDITAWTDGGIPNLVFDWGAYGAGATASLPGNIPGTNTYTVIVTDGCGMIQDTTVDITLNAAPIPTINFNQNTFTICPGGGNNAFIDATIVNPYDISQLTYNWQPTNETTEDITVSPSVQTWYFLTISDGCYSVTDSVKVDMGTLALTDIQITDATNCPGQSGLPGAINVLPNDPTWAYTLIGGGNTVGPQSNGSFNDLSGGIVYFLNVIDANGCQIDTAIMVNLGVNAVTANFVLDSLRDVVCFGDNNGGAFVENIAGGILPPYDVTWTHTTGLFASETVNVGGNSEHDDLFGGQWVVTVTDQEGCAWSSFFDIFEPDELTLDWTFSDPTCFQFSDGSVTINTSGGNGGNTFSIWDSALNNLNPSNTNAANQLVEGWYYASIEDSKGCFIEDSVLLDDPDELDVEWTINQPLCDGIPSGIVFVDTVLNWTGNYGQIGYFWNPDPNGLAQGIGATFYNHLGEGQYTLTINDENGCSNTFDFDITSPPAMTFTELGSEEAFCRQFGYQSGNGVVYAAASGGTGTPIYTWTNLQTGQTSNNSTWGGLNPGDYFISVVDDNQCYLTATIYLDSLNPIASYDVTSAQFLTPGVNEGTAEVCVQFTNTSQNFSNINDPNTDTTFFWNLDTPNADWEISHDFFEVFDTCYGGAGEYEVCLIAINKNGCSDTMCQTMIVHDPLIFVPVNIFTPNEDGNNDNFTFNYHAQAVETFHCTIVNRWGITVHEMDDITDEWNGTDMNGLPCIDGIYFYTYEGVSTDGTELKGQGNVTIVGTK